MEWKYDKIVIIFFGNLDISIFFHIQNLKTALWFFENFWEDRPISSYFKNKKKLGQIVSDMVCFPVSI